MGKDWVLLVHSYNSLYSTDPHGNNEQLFLFQIMELIIIACFVELGVFPSVIYQTYDISTKFEDLFALSHLLH
jgi:hypothetical protein